MDTCASQNVESTAWWLSFNPFEKYANVKMREFLPQIGVKIKNIWNHHLVQKRIVAS